MNQVSPQEHQGINEDNGIGRLNALSDGVFAFAMTLLVLNIEVPNDISENLVAQKLPSRLIALVPPLLSSVISFLVIGLLQY